MHTEHACTCGPLPHRFTPRFNRATGSSQGVSYAVEQRGRCEWHRRPLNSYGIQRCIPITWNRAGSSRNSRHICTQRRQEQESQVDCKQHMRMKVLLYSIGCTRSVLYLHTYVSTYVQTVRTCIHHVLP